MSSAETNWLETSPGRVRAPPRSPCALSVSGSAAASCGRVSAPWARRASRRSPSGRRRSCGAASKSYTPSPAAAAASRKRAAVPASAQNTAASAAGGGPPAPVTRRSPPRRFTAMPRLHSAAANASVSPASSAPRSTDSPAARPASSRARLVMLLEPGTRTRTSRPGRAGRMLRGWEAWAAFMDRMIPQRLSRSSEGRRRPTAHVRAGAAARPSLGGPCPGDAGQLPSRREYSS